jgi:hypothetical protein
VPSPLRSARRFACVAALALLVLLCAAAAASARTLSASPVGEGAGSLVFRIAHVAPGDVSAARLSLGKRAHRLSLRSVRAGLRRGVVRVPRPRGARRVRRPRTRLVLELRPSPPASKPVARPVPTPAPVQLPAPKPAAPTTDPIGPVAVPVPDTPAPPAGALYVSPDGSDADAGTPTAPWRTVAKAIRSARPGDTVVLREGAYGALGTTTNVDASGAPEAPITIMGEPGSGRPALLGYVRITGSHLRLQGLLFDGPTGPVLPRTDSNPKGEEVQVSVMYGSDVEISGSEVRDNAWHAGIFVSDATDVRLVGNHIHDNGDRSDPSQANLDHGIYWCSGSGVVANNLIDHNLAYGVHIYPEAHNVTVTQNTVVRSGRGGVIVADQAANNLVANNVIAYNEFYGIRGYDLTGPGNVARRNLLWHNGSENFSGAGIALADNLVADPRLTGDGDLRPLPSSPAVDAASPLAVMPVDFAGVARPRGGAPDIGAYEAG